MLAHIALETRPGDVDAELRFWAALGFVVVAPPASVADRATWVERSGTQIHLLPTDSPVVTPLGHTAVVCPDYVEVVDALVRLGVEIDERARHWGAPRCFVRSPGGHRVEVMQARPGDV